MTVMITNRQKQVKIDRQQLQKDTANLLNLLNLSNVEVSILISNDAMMKKLNTAYRNKEKTTDVLSFPMYGSQKEIPDGSDREAVLGDIVINAHMASQTAHETGAPLHYGMRRLLIHGLLHLIGYDHEKNSYQSKKMLKSEKQLFDALAQLDREP